MLNTCIQFWRILDTKHFLNLVYIWFWDGKVTHIRISASEFWILLFGRVWLTSMYLITKSILCWSKIFFCHAFWCLQYWYSSGTCFCDFASCFNFKHGCILWKFLLVVMNWFDNGILPGFSSSCLFQIWSDCLISSFDAFLCPNYLSGVNLLALQLCVFCC